MTCFIGIIKLGKQLQDKMDNSELVPTFYNTLPEVHPYIISDLLKVEFKGFPWLSR